MCLTGGSEKAHGSALREGLPVSSVLLWHVVRDRQERRSSHGLSAVQRPKRQERTEQPKSDSGYRRSIDLLRSSVECRKPGLRFDSRVFESCRDFQVAYRYIY